MRYLTTGYLGASEPPVRGAACPICGGYSRIEPGGLRCLTAGHMFLSRKVIPKSGHDWANRIRQEAVDRAFVSPGRGGQIPLDMLQKLEGRGEDAE